MASGGRFQPIKELADEVAAGPDILDYLKARGLDHIPTLALVAKTDAEFDQHVFQPFAQGFVKGNVTHLPADGEACVAKAMLCHI